MYNLYKYIIYKMFMYIANCSHLYAGVWQLQRQLLVFLGSRPVVACLPHAVVDVHRLHHVAGLRLVSGGIKMQFLG